MTAPDPDILSADIVQDMHRKFMAGIAAKAGKALPEGTRKADKLTDALEALLIECARKDIQIKDEELAAVAADGLKAVQKRLHDVEETVHVSGPTSSNYPSPNFSNKQKKIITKAARGRTERTAVQTLFGNDDRLYMRLTEEEEADDPNSARHRVAAYLEAQGYRIVDYKGGYATNAAGKQQFKIGKLLKSEPDLLKAFYEDASRTLSSLMIVVSRNADDIARMSTGRAWSSCMGSGGFNHHYVPEDIAAGTLVAYLVSEKDPDIISPLARILLKPYISPAANRNTPPKGLRKIFTRTQPEPVETVFVPSVRYGIHNDAFSNQVEGFTNKVLNAGIFGEFELQEGLYLDNGPKKIVRKEGSPHKTATGTLEWWVDGQLHREDGPAVEHPDGAQEWHRRGRLHRDGAPAVVDAAGAQTWYKNGLVHRADGPAYEQPDGTREWYLNGQRHRAGGPAIERADGFKAWIRHGSYHREDGPAVVKADGTKQWYLNNRTLTQEEFNNWRAQQDVRPPAPPFPGP